MANNAASRVRIPCISPLGFFANPLFQAVQAQFLREYKLVVVGGGG
jgi:hypothetical protein